MSSGFCVLNFGDGDVDENAFIDMEILNVSLRRWPLPFDDMILLHERREHFAIRCQPAMLAFTGEDRNEDEYIGSV